VRRWSGGWISNMLLPYRFLKSNDPVMAVSEYLKRFIIAMASRIR